jgi:hypothetical protein
MKRKAIWLKWLGLTAIVWGCGGSAIDTGDSVEPCTPGRQVSCACLGAETGVQLCLSDQTFGQCDCAEQASDAGRGGTAHGGPDAPSAGGQTPLAGSSTEPEGGFAIVSEGGAAGSLSSAGFFFGSAGTPPSAIGEGAATTGGVASGGAAAGAPTAPDSFAGEGPFQGAGGASCDVTDSAVREVGSYFDASLDVGCDLKLEGQVSRLVYDASHERAYGLDHANKRLSVIDLDEGGLFTRNVVQIPSALCVQPEKNRLFVVNSGSSFITEYTLPTLSYARDIPWPAPSWGSEPQIDFEVYCGKDRLYIVDESWAPGLWTIEDLDGCPHAVDHTAQLSGIGALVLSPNEDELYYWYQYGWSAGSAGSDVHRLWLADLSELDASNLGYPNFYRDPLDAPILWDHERSYIFAKDRVFNAENLQQVVYSFPDASPNDIAASESAYALDEKRGRVATRNNVYSLDNFNSIAAVDHPDAAQYFFDKHGRLRQLLTGQNRLACQTLP